MIDATWIVLLNWLSLALLMWSGWKSHRAAGRCIASMEDLIVNMAARLADLETEQEEKRTAIELYRCFKKFQLDRDKKKPFFGGPCR